MKYSQSYYCGKCNKFVMTYTTHMKPQYDGVFWGYPVKQRDSYCPYCGKKSTFGELPPIEHIKSFFNINDDDYDDDENDYDEYDDELDDEEDEEYDEHDWTLPEDDKSVREFVCESCGEDFKIGYCDGRKRKAFCPLCGGKAKRVVENQGLKET